MKKVILNCCPPADMHIPSPSLSVLQAYLQMNNYEVEVKYWNLYFHYLQNEFIWNDARNSNEITILYLYFNYIAIMEKNADIYTHLKLFLQTINPKFLSDDPDCYDRHMEVYARKLDSILDEVISSFNMREILFFGFTMKMDQWLLASIIAKKIKERDVEIPIVIGGINTEKGSIGFLNSFPQFDVAMWGEGELAILELARMINKESPLDFSKIGNIAFREDDIIKCSANKLTKFVDLSDLNFLPNYDDYFKQKEEYRIVSPTYLPIEGSRGCHWNRCKFCYLSVGYKYRLKSIEKIEGEIRYMIKKYGIYLFEFLDNDLIGKDTGLFVELLDTLILLRKEFPAFQIIVAEIITKEVDKKIIEKMKEAGIICVQIGYENSSDNILKKIDKKNSFASNMNFIKHAFFFGIQFRGINVIINLPEETTGDIFEACQNLSFLRFFLNWKTFRHCIIPVCVNSSSRYANVLNLESSNLHFSTTMYLLASFYVEKESHWDLFEYVNPNRDSHWYSFQRIENYYLQVHYTYEIINHGDNYLYIEYCNGQEISSFKFVRNSLDYYILKLVDSHVISIDDLTDEINIVGKKYVQEDIKVTLETLFKKRLVYYSQDFQEIASVISFEG